MITIDRTTITRATAHELTGTLGDRRNRQLIVAIGKADTELVTIGKWAWFADTQTLKIASRTTPGRWYLVGADGCDPECPAAQNGRVCWHVMAWRILIRAQELATEEAAMAANLEAAHAEWLAATDGYDPALVASHQRDADDLFG